MLNTNFNHKILLNVQRANAFNLFELLTLARYISNIDGVRYGGYALCNVVDSNEQEKGNWGIKTKGLDYGLGGRMGWH